MKNIILIGFIILTLGLSSIGHAATTPTLSDSSTYAILSSTYTDTSGATTINADVGFTTPPATPPLGTQTNYGSGAPYSVAGTDQAAVLALLNAQPCDFTFGAATDLSLETQPLQPGVYCITGAQSVGTAGITLLSGTYIFRSTGALNTVANSVVSGGNACDVFWTPTATTLGANSTFFGTVIDDAGITVGAVTTWLGRALAFGGTVTTDTNTITVPNCAPVVPTPPSPPVPTPSSGSSHSGGTKRCDTSTTLSCEEYFRSPAVSPAVSTVVAVPEVLGVSVSPYSYPTPSMPSTGGSRDYMIHLLQLASILIVSGGLSMFVARKSR